MSSRNRWNYPDLVTTSHLTTKMDHTYSQHSSLKEPGKWSLIIWRTMCTKSREWHLAQATTNLQVTSATWTCLSTVQELHNPQDITYNTRDHKRWAARWNKEGNLKTTPPSPQCPWEITSSTKPCEHHTPRINWRAKVPASLETPLLSINNVIIFINPNNSKNLRVSWSIPTTCFTSPVPWAPLQATFDMPI